METAQSSARTGYLAYDVTDESRIALLRRFPPKYPDVICHHMTYRYPAEGTDELPPQVREAMVVGYAEEPGLEALVVEIDGQTARPSDGRRFHITLSLDARAGKTPVQSNALLSRDTFTPVAPFSIQVQPALLWE